MSRCESIGAFRVWLGGPDRYVQIEQIVPEEDGSKRVPDEVDIMLINNAQYYAFVFDGEVSVYNENPVVKLGLEDIKDRKPTRMKMGANWSWETLATYLASTADIANFVLIALVSKR